MMGIGALTKLLTQMAEPPVALQRDSCLNQRNKQTDCHLCVVLCSKEAIALGESVVVNAERCVACGLCWRGCPTEALTLRSMDHRKLLSQAYALIETDTRIEFACPRRGEGGPSAGCQAVLEMTCLAQVSVPLIVGSIEKGAKEVWLNDSRCGECELRATQRQIGETALAARQILEAFGRAGTVHLYSEDGARLEGQGRTARRLRAEDSVRSRRELLSIFSSRLLTEVKGSITEPIANVLDTLAPPPSTRRVLPQKVPSERLLLLGILRGMGAPALDSYPLTGWRLARAGIDDRCSGCELCSMFCPTGAIVRTERAGELSIEFHAAYCVDCKICEAVCPSSSLRLQADVTLADLLQENGNVLVKGPIVTCSECGGSCLGRGSRPLCFICAKKGEFDRQGEEFKDSPAEE